MKFFDLDDPSPNIPAVKACLDFIKGNNMKDMPDGKYQVNDDIAVSILHTKTEDPEKGVWEAHRKFVDLHYIIIGRELMYIGKTQQMQTGEYVEGKDYLPVNGDWHTYLCMNSGTAVLLFPNDAHKGKIVPNGCNSELVKKAIFKIPLSIVK